MNPALASRRRTLENTMYKEYVCKTCSNTGSTSDEGFMDCITPGCEAATTRAAFDKWLLQEGYPQSGIKEWSIYRHAVRTERLVEMAQLHAASEVAKAVAAPAAPAAAVVTVDTPEFWDVANKWAVSRFVSTNEGIKTSQALIAYIEAYTAQSVAQALEAQQDALTEVTAQRDALRERLSAPQQHAQSFPSLEEFHARFSPPKGYEDCRVISRNDQLIWLRDADVLPTDLICFFDGDCRDVLTPYDNRVQPPMKLVQHAQAAQGEAEMLRDVLAIQEACGLHTDEYAPGSVIEYIKELETEKNPPAKTPISKEWYERMAKAEIEADVNIEAGNAQAALSDEQIDALRDIASSWMSESGRDAMEDWIDTQRASQQPAAAPAKHADDIAVDRFAMAMKHKLAVSRDKGRSGWNNELQCTMGMLAKMLVEHVAKGDPVDIANFAMMLHQREAAAFEHHPCYGGDAVRVIRHAVEQAATPPTPPQEAAPLSAPAIQPPRVTVEMVQAQLNMALATIESMQRVRAVASVTHPQEAAARDDLQTLLTAFDMGLSFALCHRDFGDMRGAVKKLQVDFAEIRAAAALAPAPVLPAAGGDAEAPRTIDRAAFTQQILLSVAEIPDRDSPEDQPEMMLVTSEELSGIIASAFETAGEAARPSPAQGEALSQQAGFEEGKRFAHEQATVVTHRLMAERDAAYQQGRAAGLEEAAKVCSSHAQNQKRMNQQAEMYVADFLARAIRALNKQEPAA